MAGNGTTRVLTWPGLTPTVARAESVSSGPSPTAPLNMILLPLRPATLVMPEDFRATISLTPGVSSSPAASTLNGPSPWPCAASSAATWPAATSTRPDLIAGTSSEVLATVRIVTCRPWAAKIPRFLARYRATTDSTGVAPIVISFFSGLPLAVVLDDEPHAAAESNSATLRMAVATARRGDATFMGLLRAQAQRTSSWPKADKRH